MKSEGKDSIRFDTEILVFHIPYEVVKNLKPFTMECVANTKEIKYEFVSRSFLDKYCISIKDCNGELKPLEQLLKELEREV